MFYLFYTVKGLTGPSDMGRRRSASVLLAGSGARFVDVVRVVV